MVHNAARADLILGPIGVILANGILGEVSPAMAAAVSGCQPATACLPVSVRISMRRIVTRRAVASGVGRGQRA